MFFYAFIINPIVDLALFWASASGQDTKFVRKGRCKTPCRRAKCSRLFAQIAHGSARSTIGFISLLISLQAGLFSENLIQPKPITIITGEESGLNRPEGIDFSPSGDCIAVANSNLNSIVIYNRIGTSGSNYETKPSSTIEGSQSHLNYPHDVSFSPDGKHLAVANRYGNSVTIYKKNKNGSFHSTPTVEIGAPKVKFSGAGAVAYSPKRKILAVADSYNNAVLLFRYKNNHYEKKPYCILELSSLEIPDGLCFSPDGKRLAISYHSTHAIAIFKRSKYSSYLFNSDPECLIKCDELKYPHSVSFHPSNQYLVISSAGGTSSVNVFKKQSEGSPQFTSSPVQTIVTYNPQTIYMQRECPDECGAKGIALSKDGKTIAVCNPDLIESDTIFIYDFKPNH